MYNEHRLESYFDSNEVKFQVLMKQWLAESLATSA